MNIKHGGISTYTHTRIYILFYVQMYTQKAHTQYSNLRLHLCIHITKKQTQRTRTTPLWNGSVLFYQATRAEV